MEPHGNVSPQDLHDLRIELLRKAVDIYLAIAYPNAAPPDSVARRLNWPDEPDAALLLARPPFERVTRPGAEGPVIYALRLGNTRYPHMKLQIQPWENPAGFMLSVNTHDQVLGLAPDAADYEVFRSLQSENQRIKEEIEAAWDAEGLPIFLSYLRDYLRAHPGSIEAAG